MKTILLCVVYFLYLILTIDSKKFRVILSDEILQYVDKHVMSLPDVVSIEHLSIEQLDDDLIEVGGYGEFKIPMNPNLPMVVFFQTQYYANSIWNEGMLRLNIPDTCPEMMNPTRPFYNISKLWTNCPGQIGDKWVIEPQNISIIVDLPSSIPIVPWRVYILGSQGIPGFETFKTGFGLNLELLPI